MPILKDKQVTAERKSTKKTDKPTSSPLVIDDALFAEIVRKDFFKERRERIAKILEQVDWSEKEKKS